MILKIGFNIIQRKSKCYLIEMKEFKMNLQNNNLIYQELELGNNRELVMEYMRESNQDKDRDSHLTKQQGPSLRL